MRLCLTKQTYIYCEVYTLQTHEFKLYTILLHLYIGFIDIVHSQNQSTYTQSHRQLERTAKVILTLVGRGQGCATYSRYI